MTIPIVTQKTCTKCKASQPLTNFTPDKRSPSGLKAQCRTCVNAYCRERSGTQIVAEKQCGKCKQTLDRSHFTLSSYSVDGLRSHCRDCGQKATRAYKDSPQWEVMKQIHREQPKRQVTEKRCTKCGEIRQHTDFYIVHYAQDGLDSQCKICARERGRLPEVKHRSNETRRRNINQNRITAAKYQESLKQTPEGRRKLKHYRLKSNYGITIDDYEQMLHHQQGVCYICHYPPKKYLVVDHCHTTNQVRGLLCNLCNSLLGAWKDNIECAERAFEYLLNNGAPYLHHFSDSESGSNPAEMANCIT